MPTATNVTTGIVRLSYANLFKPRANTDGADPKYSACLLIPKSDTATFKAIKEACEAARVASSAKFNGKVPDKLKLPIHDGDGEMPNGGEYPQEAKGHWVMNASSKLKPRVVDRAVCDIIDETLVYSGCYIRAALNFFAYNTNGNRGIACGLNMVQKVRDGEPLGGAAPDPKSVFTTIEDDEEDLGI